MKTTREQISEWFDRGVSLEATHMLVVVDTFDYEDFPVYCRVDPEMHSGNQGQRAEPKRVGEVTVAPSSYAVAVLHDGVNMEKVMEVYDLSMDKESQLAEEWAFHY